MTEVVMALLLAASADCARWFSNLHTECNSNVSSGLTCLMSESHENRQRSWPHRSPLLNFSTSSISFHYMLAISGSQSPSESDEDSDISASTTECNIETVGELFQDEPQVDTFEVVALGSVEEQALYDTVEYCSKWRLSSGLFLAKEHLIRRAYAHNNNVGLFKLFLNSSFLECVRQWTSKELSRRGRRKKALRMDELMAFLGLELATSVHRLNRLRDYWCSSELLCTPFFKKVMSRDSFLNIRSALRLYSDYEHDVATSDPLWHTRQVLEHFGRNAATLAVPVGVSSLDENTIRCKGRTRARTYMKSKPVKFGIRFYAVVGWTHAYLHSLQDNGSGNKTGHSPVQSYINVFRNLRGAVERKVDGKHVQKSSPSALWCAQMAHQTQLHPTPQHGRLMVMDNFYTRHVLARQLYVLSDGECRVLGTVRFTNVDGINRPALKNAMESLKHAKRGDWRLVQVFDKENGEVAEKTGFIVFKDRSIVSFYTNDLADTPRERIHSPDEHAVTCVHGLAPLQRWTGDEAMRRTTLHVPSIIVAYNLFMNGVDRFDQIRSTTVTQRREKRVTMSILTFILDASILNAHALLKAITTPGEHTINVGTMKQRIIMQLVTEHVQYQQEGATLIPMKRTSQREKQMSEELPLSKHVLLETIGRKRVHCFLCKLLSTEEHGGYTRYSCVECKYGFHVNWFSYFHHRELFREKRPDIFEAVCVAERSLSSKSRRKRCNIVTSTLGTAILYSRK